MDTFSIHPAAHTGPVHLIVSDLEAQLGFYRDILGLAELESSDGTVVLGTHAGTPLVYLRHLREARPRPARTTGLYHLAILLPTRRDLARVLRHLAEVRYPLGGASDHLVSEALYLADPEENGIEIYADRPRDAWPRGDGAIRMATDPLDVDGLRSELRDAEPWRAVPPGTTIGHVHLQVSDVTVAERFYHEVLGLDVIVRWRGSASFLSAGGYHHHLGLNCWTSAGAPPAPPDSTGLDYFTLYLPDAGELGKEVRRLGEAGVRVEEGPGGVLASDPSGNRVLLAVEGEPATGEAPPAMRGAGLS